MKSETGDQNRDCHDEEIVETEEDERISSDILERSARVNKLGKRAEAYRNNRNNRHTKIDRSLISIILLAEREADQERESHADESKKREDKLIINHVEPTAQMVAEIDEDEGGKADIPEKRHTERANSIPIVAYSTQDNNRQSPLPLASQVQDSLKKHERSEERREEPNRAVGKRMAKEYIPYRDIILENARHKALDGQSYQK